MDKTITLADISVGNSAYIEEINIKNTLKTRLYELGLIKNSQISCIGKSVLGDPRAYKIAGTVLAIRNCDAEQIAVKRI